MNSIQNLDLLQVIAFYAQLKNIEWDEEQNKYIHSVVENIDKQIAKLHKQNDFIVKQNSQILAKLNK